MVTMPLQQLIVERLAELGRTYREAEQVAGGLVSRATLNNIATGQHVGHIKEDTLRGVALAIDLPYRKVREAAAAPSVIPTAFRLPKRAGRLSNRQRRIILSMIDTMLEEQSSQERAITESRTLTEAQKQGLLEELRTQEGDGGVIRSAKTG